MLKRLLSLGLVLLAASSYAQVGISPGKTESPFNGQDLTAALGASTYYSLAVGNKGVNVLTWQTIYSAAPTTVTVLLEGSTDCNTFTTIDTSSNNAGEIRTLYGSWKCVRLNNSAVTGGAGKTLTGKIIYSSGNVQFNGMIQISRVLTIAEVTASGSGAPITLVPAKNGVYNQLVYAMASRTGTAYLSSPSWYIGPQGSTTILTGAAPRAWTVNPSLNVDITATNNIQAGTGGANPTVDGTNTGSPVTVNLWYREIPIPTSIP